jgi:beta-lactamase regulating signal transducer with metallopeptidase domain
MFWWFGQHLVVTGVLALLVFAGCRVLRVGPVVRHVLWLVVLIKLLTPPLVAWPWSVEDLTRPAASTTEPAATEPLPSAPSPPARAVKPAHVPPTKMAPRMPPPPLPPTKVHVEQKHEAPLANPVRLTEVTTAKDSGPAIPEAPEPAPVLTEEFEVPWEWSALGLWLVSAAGMAVVQLMRIARFRRLLRKAEPGPRHLVRLVRELAARYDIHAPEVLLVPGLTSPVVWSLGRSQLLWPAGLADRFDAEQRRGIVAHELAHLRRRDHWVGALLLLAECMWWWCPLFWLVRREIRLAAEWACDAWVVTVLPEHRRVYAETLIEVSQLISQARLPAPVLGIGGARQSFQRRLTMIMCEQVPCRTSRWALPLIGLLALAVLPAWSRAQTPILQDATERALQTERLKQALANLEDIKNRLEKELAQVKVELDDLKARGKANPAAEATLLDRLSRTQERLFDVSTTRARLSGAGRSGLQDMLVGKTQPRPWGPEQATGAPNCPDGGDNQQAWASLTEDGQDEWLILTYAEAVQPVGILIWENYNPGAVNKVSIFTSDDLEQEVWKGKDPSPVGSGRGMSLIPVKVGVKINRIKLYLSSRDVKGWNEIDAVGLLDANGKTHWASKAEASTSYADRNTTVDALDGVFVTGHNQWMPVTGQHPRLDQLEAEVKDMKAALSRIEKVIMQRGGADETNRLESENAVLRKKLQDLEERLRK